MQVNVRSDRPCSKAVSLKLPYPAHSCHEHPLPNDVSLVQLAESLWIGGHEYTPSFHVRGQGTYSRVNKR